MLVDDIRGPLGMTQQAPGASSGRYAMVTPAYNEGEYIAAMIESVCSQTVLPVKWVIVDDGSTDKTAEIINSYARRKQWIELITLPRREHRLPGGEGAIQAAIRRLNLIEVEFLARFDADLVLGPQYMEQLLEEFDREPRLGIAGGGLYVEKNGTMQLEVEPTYHVRGAVKMYRRGCFEQIGGITTQIGWDTIDEVLAWTAGWTTRSFFEYRVVHRRPTGFGLPAHHICWERGKAEYYSWSSPLFVLCKTANIATTGWAPFKALSFLGGFLSGYIRREQRLCNRVFVRTRRSQQLGRLWSMLTARPQQVVRINRDGASSPPKEK